MRLSQESSVLLSDLCFRRAHHDHEDGEVVEHCAEQLVFFQLQVLLLRVS